MENQPKYVRFNCWGNSGRSPFAAAVADNYLVQKGLEGAYRADSAGVGVEGIISAALNPFEFALNPKNKGKIEQVLKIGLARADRKILFAGLDDAAERYLNGELTELTPRQAGHLVNRVMERCSYEEREARAAAAREFGFRTDLLEHISTQTTPRVGVVIDFAMDRKVLEKLQDIWRTFGGPRPFIAELGPYSTGDPEFSFEDGAFGKLEPNHESYLRFAFKVAPVVRMAIDKAQKEGLLPLS